MVVERENARMVEGKMKYWKRAYRQVLNHEGPSAVGFALRLSLNGVLF